MTLYTHDIESMEDLVDWLTEQNESDTLVEPFDFHHNGRKDRVRIRFVEGDTLNAPARLCDALDGTMMRLTSLSVEGTATAVVKYDR